MSTTFTVEKFQELIENEEFCAKLHAVDSIEKAQTLLSEYGVEITVEELQQEMENAKMIMKEKGMISEGGELSAEMLEMVTGGANWRMALLFGIGAAVSVATGQPGACVFCCCMVAAALMT